MSSWYNENDPNKAEWLRELIKRGLIAPGKVDERSIRDVRPEELVGFTQCHFFAGIGVWSYALRRAGWPDSRPVWTGSCPCPSFSAAGKGNGFTDPRHLWPEWYRLIRERRPASLFGEQVAAAIGHGWLDLVCGDLEAEGYAVAAAVLGAHSAGAPHIRQRLYFVAHANFTISECSERRGDGPSEETCGRPHSEPTGRSNPCQLDNAASARCERPEQGPETDSRHEAWMRGPGDGRSPMQLGQPLSAGLEGHARDGRDGNQPGRQRAVEAGSVTEAGEPCRLADAEHRGLQEGRLDGTSVEDGDRRRHSATIDVPAAAEFRAVIRPGSLNGFWRDADWIGCRDGKWRPVEPGTSPLANGAAARVVRLRGYGDGICAETAQIFIEEVIEELK